MLSKWKYSIVSTDKHCGAQATLRTAGTVGEFVPELRATLCPLLEEEVASRVGTRQEVVIQSVEKSDNRRR